jgi:predicted DNA-binding transcriptional regulator YafY
VRADRLIALALLLQARGRLTAEELAQRLEVSVRTIYRDLDALSTAGVPVYTASGPGGGVSLPNGYRLDLTALNKEEARALFLGGFAGTDTRPTSVGDIASVGNTWGAAGTENTEGTGSTRGVGKGRGRGGAGRIGGVEPAGGARGVGGPLADLGVGAVLDGALRKLTAALPPENRDEAERARERLLVDTDDWWPGISTTGSGVAQPTGAAPWHLRTIEEALWRDRQVRISYPRRVREAGSMTAVDGPLAERVVHPYALVAKRGVWYLVAATEGQTAGPRVYRVSRVRTAEVLDAPSRRPPDFDLRAFWAQWCAEFVRAMPRYDVTLRVAPALAAQVARNPVKGRAFPARVIDADGVDADRPPGSGRPAESSGAGGWVTMVVDLEALEVALPPVLSYGPDVEVLAPAELRAEVAAAVVGMAARYGGEQRSAKRVQSRSERD